MLNINNDIKEPICSFKVSNLLKEKGFDVLSTAFYHKTKKELVDPKSYADLVINKNSDFSTASFITAPTHSIALEWIRVNFLIDIESRAVRYAGDEKASYYSANVNGSVVLFQKRFDTPSEAIDAALLHVLEEII
jgi:hypothetical protein